MARLRRTLGATLMVAAAIASAGSARAAPGAVPGAEADPGVQGCLDRGGFHDRRFDTGEVEIAYSEGPAGGPTLLIIPGMGVPRASYARAAARLCRRFHVVVVDQRGQGGSAWSRDGRYRVVDYGRDAARLVEQRLNRGPVIVSGHSLGGLVALWLAAERPDLVAGLVAEDNPFLMSERGRWEHHWIKPMFEGLERRLRLYHASGRREEVLVAAFAAEPAYLPRQDAPLTQRVRALGKWLSNLDAAGVGPADPQEALRLEAGYAAWLAGKPVSNSDLMPRAALLRAPLVSAAMDPAVPHAAVTAELNDGFGHRDAMARVRAPVLYWNSDQDLVGVIPQDEHDENVRIMGRNVRVRHMVARGVGHLIHAEAPDLFAREIGDFFLPNARPEPDALP